MTQQLRRPMGAALRTSDLSPDALAFIQAGTPQPKFVEPVKVIASPVKPETPEMEPPQPGPPNDNQPETIERSRTPKPRGQREKTAEPVHPVSRITLSIRVPYEIPEGLLRASTDRKLKHLKPSTQQEIAAEAISRWLRENGYL